MISQRIASSIKPHNLSDHYWASLTDFDRSLFGRIRPLPSATYTVDNRLNDIESYITRESATISSEGGTFELEPDFQRGHKWSDEQRISYVEALLRKTAPKTILFNCPGWTMGKSAGGDIPRHTFQCIDGLQRLTAVRKFLAGEIEIFGDLTAAKLKGSSFDLRSFYLTFAIYEFANRAELLQFYLDLNAGGTVHTQGELDRVRLLRDEAAPLDQDAEVTQALQEPTANTP